MTDTPKALITNADACDQLHVDRSTLSRWINAGQINYTQKLPGKTGGYLFTQAQIDAVLAVRGRAYRPHPGDPYVES